MQHGVSRLLTAAVVVVQTVQYIQPQHAAQLSQAELVVIDEAAAIPLPVVKALVGPYLVFLCSTVNGYEGTGRSLSLKLIHQLRSEVRGATRQACLSIVFLLCLIVCIVCVFIYLLDLINYVFIYFVCLFI